MKHRQGSLLCILMLLGLCSHYIRMYPIYPPLVTPQAKLSDNESKLALACPVKLSDMSLDQLEFLPGVSAKRAQAIYELNGKSLQDQEDVFKALIGIKGIGKQTAKRIVSFLSGNGASPHCPTRYEQKPAAEFLEFNP